MKFDYIDKLIKPQYQPPAWVFRLVWPILYFLLFLSFYVYMTAKTTHSKEYGIIFFVIQLFLNFIWTPVFFGLKKIGLASFVSILLLVFTGLMIYSFGQVSTLAALLNIPYFLWLVFAVVLNFVIWQKN